MAALMALLFPMTGIVRGMRAIRRFPIGGRNDLEIAARAGALCRVMRNLPTEEILGHDASEYQRQMERKELEIET
jgi:hypothetical protein